MLGNLGASSGMILVNELGPFQVISSNLGATWGANKLRGRCAAI